MMTDRAGGKSIGRFILGHMTLGPLIPFLVLLGVGAMLFSGAMEKSIMARLSQTARDHGALVDTFLKERRADLVLLASGSSFDSLSRSEALRRALTHLKASSGAFMDLGVFDAAGVHVAYVGPYALEGIDYHGEVWFQKTMVDGFWISDLFSGFRKSPHVVVAVRGTGDQGLWVLRATLDADRFQALVGGAVIGETGDAFLINGKGFYQSRRPLWGTEGGEARHATDYLTGTRLITCRDGQSRVVASISLREKPWRLVVAQERSEAFESLPRIYAVIFGIMVVGGVGLCLMGYALTARIVARLRHSDDQAVALEEQLYRAARLAELGEMAAGFAHEINNPLQVMQSELACMEAGIGDVETGIGDLSDLKASVAQMSLQIDRCSDITRSVLHFGRKSPATDRVVALEEFLVDVAAMVRTRAESGGVSFQVDIPVGGGEVWGDPSRLQQVFLNLINNALDAVVTRHGSCGGAVRVGVRPLAETLCVDVIDNGDGMDEGLMGKIFTPFFTSKPPGSGTGLGLSVCHSIVESMGGRIEVASVLGEGSRFTVSLPRHR